MIQVGSPFPSLTVKQMTSQGIEDISLTTFCQNKKVVLVGVPGAFTPICSTKHLPGFVKDMDKLKSKGIDAVMCLSVNDAFVMDAWGKSLNIGDKIMMLADGTGQATKLLGLDIDLSTPGLGIRSKRYSMVIDKGIVKSLWVEDNPGICDVSSADAVLNAI